MCDLANASATAEALPRLAGWQEAVLGLLPQDEAALAETVATIFSNALYHCRGALQGGFPNSLFAFPAPTWCPQNA